MLTILFSEGGQPLAEREWPTVPRIGDNLKLRDSTGLFEVIRVTWEERKESRGSVVASVSLLSSAR